MAQTACDHLFRLVRNKDLPGALPVRTLHKHRKAKAAAREVSLQQARRLTGGIVHRNRRKINPRRLNSGKAAPGPKPRGGKVRMVAASAVGDCACAAPAGPRRE